VPNPISAEAAAIQEAYQDQVKTSFKELFLSLVAEPVTHGTDQQAVEKFTTGIKLAKRAKDLALDAVSTTSPATSPATARRARTKRK
jgi:hypothetical protein